MNGICPQTLLLFGICCWFLCDPIPLDNFKRTIAISHAWKNQVLHSTAPLATSIQWVVAGQQPDFYRQQRTERVQYNSPLTSRSFSQRFRKVQSLLYSHQLDTSTSTRSTFHPRTRPFLPIQHTQFPSLRRRTQIDVDSTKSVLQAVVLFQRLKSWW